MVAGKPAEAPQHAAPAAHAPTGTSTGTGSHAPAAGASHHDDDDAEDESQEVHHAGTTTKAPAHGRRRRAAAATTTSTVVHFNPTTSTDPEVVKCRTAVEGILQKASATMVKNHCDASCAKLGCHAEKKGCMDEKNGDACFDWPTDCEAAFADFEKAHPEVASTAVTPPACPTTTH